jgi:hypothetical protein
MKCRIWKKLHREEAARFDAAWELVEKNSSLPLADAFAIVQSGMSIPEFQARKERLLNRQKVKEARATIAGESIEAFIAAFITDKTEVAVVMAERTAFDIVTSVKAISFQFERGGHTEKIQVVLMTRKATWDELSPKLVRDAKLMQKPEPVSRQPSRRPLNDPRPLLPHVGDDVTLFLRNGIILTMPLLTVGPFDVLVGTTGSEIFVPLHAMLRWQPATGAPDSEPLP